MIAIETTLAIIDCISDYYFNIDLIESYPTSVYYTAIMFRDVRDHTFSSLDSLWSLRKVFILPRASCQNSLRIKPFQEQEVSRFDLLFCF